MNDEWLLSVTLPTAQLAHALEAAVQSRTPDAVAEIDGRDVSIRTADRRAERLARDAVTQFLTERRIEAEVVTRRKATAAEWREESRTQHRGSLVSDYSPALALPADVDVPGTPLVRWIDITPLRWETRLNFADDASVDEAVELLAQSDDGFWRRRRTVAIYSATEDAADEHARHWSNVRGVASIDLRELTRVQRWLMRQRLAGNYDTGTYPYR